MQQFYTITDFLNIFSTRNHVENTFRIMPQLADLMIRTFLDLSLVLDLAGSDH